ncbi:MAG: hypothetical protein E4H14_16515 [Candidatus Thorarchaeota archaeon]|nr:MAG: hypothetical protein E4H14_16515 [Candidatus Thorarchaeota archaeon]
MARRILSVIGLGYVGLPLVFKLVTANDEYLNLDLNHLKKLMRTKVVIDGRNVFDNTECQKNGFVFRGVGR